MRFELVDVHRLLERVRLIYPVDDGADAAPIALAQRFDLPNKRVDGWRKGRWGTAWRCWLARWGRRRDLRARGFLQADYFVAIVGMPYANPSEKVASCAFPSMAFENDLASFASPDVARNSAPFLEELLALLWSEQISCHRAPSGAPSKAQHERRCFARAKLLNFPLELVASRY